MGRLIKRSTDTQHLGVPSIEITSDDFNDAEPYKFKVVECGSNDINDEMCVDIGCSSDTPGIKLTIRDTNEFTVLDEQEIANHILAELNQNSKKIWDCKFLEHAAKLLIKGFLQKGAMSAHILYAGTSFYNGGVVRIDGTPVTIFNFAEIHENAILLKSVTGMMSFENMKTPDITIYLNDNEAVLLKHPDINIVHGGSDTYDLVADSFEASFVHRSSELDIPSEALENKDAAEHYLMQQKMTVRRDDTFADIDLF